MTEKSTLQILTEARAKLAQGWCTFVFAKTKTGHWVDPRSDEAIAFCAMGALSAASESRPYTCATQPAEIALEECLPEIFEYKGFGPGDRVAQFNNMTSQADVLNLFDRAIAKLAPTQRPTSELVADLMTQVLSTPVIEPVVEEETA